MTLETTRVRLDALEPSDYAWLEAVELATDRPFQWRFGGRTPSPAEYEGATWRDILEHRVVRRSQEPRDSVPIAVVTAYSPNFRNQTAWIRFVTARDEEGSLAFAGIGLFIHHIFTHYPLRQIYAQAHDYALANFASGSGLVFEHIVSYKDHVRYQGRSWDSHVLMIRRDSWFEGIGRLVSQRTT